MEDLKRLLSEKPCKNYSSFIKIVEFAVQNAWKNEVLFIAAYPDEDVNQTPIITHKIELKEPGLVGNNREIKPRLRYSGKTDNGKTYNVWGQWFDYEVRFDIWGSTGEEADKIVEQFEQLMLQYLGYFQKKGVSKVFFKRQINDEGTNQWRVDLMNRTLIYHVRLDETKVTLVDNIETIDIAPYIYPYLIDKITEEQ